MGLGTEWNSVVVPARPDALAGEINSLESMPGLLKSLKIPFLECLIRPFPPHFLPEDQLIMNTFPYRRTRWVTRPRLDGSADQECLTFSTGGSADHLPGMVPPAKNHILHHIEKVLDVNLNWYWYLRCLRSSDALKQFQRQKFIRAGLQFDLPRHICYLNHTNDKDFLKEKGVKNPGCLS